MAERYTIVGHIAWAHLYEPDNAFGASKWKLQIFPDGPEQMEIFKKSGIRKKLKTNDNPEKNVPLGEYFELSRDTSKMIKGSLVNFTGPIVEREDGTVIVDYVNTETGRRAFSFDPKEKDKIVRRGQPVLLGNGSKVAVTFTVYPWKNAGSSGVGQRLESVKVIDLVEYDGAGGELPPVEQDVVNPIRVDNQEVPDSKEDVKTPW